MSNFTLTNLSDGTTQTVAGGGLISITLRLGGQRIIAVRIDDSVGLSPAMAYTWQVAFDSGFSSEFAGINFVTPTGTADVYFPSVQYRITPTNITLKGDYYGTISTFAEAGGLVFFRLKITVVSSGNVIPQYENDPNNGGNNGALPLDWLTGNLCDLRLDLGSRAVVSRFLALLKGGCKIGDQLVFAVLLSLDGAAITADVTEIALAIRAPGEFDESDYLFLTVSGVTSVDAGGGNSYYSLAATLDTFALRDWFDAINSKNPTPSGDALTIVFAMAELRVTYASRVYTSATFTFPILQPVNALA